MPFPRSFGCWASFPCCSQWKWGNTVPIWCAVTSEGEVSLVRSGGGLAQAPREPHRCPGWRNTWPSLLLCAVSTVVRARATLATGRCRAGLILPALLTPLPQGGGRSCHPTGHTWTFRAPSVVSSDAMRCSSYRLSGGESSGFHLAFVGGLLSAGGVTVSPVGVYP